MPGTRKFWIKDDVSSLSDRFKPISPIGQGAFGIVFSATLKSNSGEVVVAIKKLKNIFATCGSFQRVLQEIFILQAVSHENVLRLRELIVPKGGSFDEVYLVTDFMETDLGAVIKSPQELDSAHIKVIFFQVVQGLEYIHSLNLIHGDVKPRNILLNSNCDVKICDFGLATVAESRYSIDTCTRWYRSPEALLLGSYPDFKGDVFSVGCVLGEMVARKPLLPGVDDEDQLMVYLKRFGAPFDDMDWIDIDTRIHLISMKFDLPSPDLEKYLYNKGKGNPDREELCLLQSLCNLDPNKRPTMTTILSEAWFGDLRKHRKQRSQPTVVKTDVPVGRTGQDAWRKLMRDIAATATRTTDSRNPEPFDVHLKVIASSDFTPR
jgi:serine/threonine protein kinase